DPYQVLVVDRHRMPFGALFPLAGLAVAPGLGGGDAQVADLAARGEAAHLGVAAQVADQDDLVHRSRHHQPPVARILGDRRIPAEAGCETVNGPRPQTWRRPALPL